MIERLAIVHNSAGIHCRPSACIIKAAATMACEITVSPPAGEDIDLKSMLALVALGLEKGARVRIRTEGPDEASCCEQLVALFEREFDFPALDDPERSEAAERLLFGA